MFGKQLPLMTLLGFQIRLDLSWVMIAVLITWTLAVGVFPAYVPELAPSAYWSMGVVAALGLFASIILHELAHAVVARRYGLPISGITLFIFGGVAHMEDEPESAKVEFLVAVAGPIASFAIAAACYLLTIATGALGWPQTVVAVVGYLAVINLVVAVFNLVPAFPLDGGRMLRAALWHWKGRLRWATRISSAIGSGFGIALIALGVLRVLQADLIGGLWWILIGLFVRSAAQLSYRQVVVREGLRGVRVDRFMSREPVAVTPDLSVAALVEDYIYHRQFEFFPVVEGDRLIGCISLSDVKRVPREQWPETAVGAIMQSCTNDNVVAPNADALDVLTAMNRRQNGRMIVAENGRLAGVVTLKDLLRFLSLKLALEDDEGDPALRAASAEGPDWQRLRRATGD